MSTWHATARTATEVASRSMRIARWTSGRRGRRSAARYDHEVVREDLPSNIAVSAAREFVAALRRRFGSALVDARLFGSVARGTASEESDVDIAVILEQVDFATHREVIDLATEIGLSVDRVLSPNVFDEDTYRKWRMQERPLVMDIEREGVPL
jgi:predicted nucleotidyltransferase